MSGTRPFTDTEIQALLLNLNTPRNKALVVLGLKTGFRISELLSIKVKDVCQFNKIKESITINRARMKGKKTSRTVVLHHDAQIALELMGVLKLNSEDKLFPICRMQASRLLKNAINKAKIEGNVSTHSMRKSFAKKIYDALKGDLIGTQKALGHKNINSTVSYLSFEQEKIDEAIKGV